MKKHLLIYAWLLLPLCQGQAQSWQEEDVGQGIKPGIAVSASDVVYISYMSEDIQGFIDVTTIQNGSMSTDQVTTGYFYGPADITLDNNGLPRIVYHDHNSEDLGYASYSTTSGWSASSIFSPGHDGWDGDIIVDGQNMIHVSTTDPSHGVEYYHHNGQTWNVTTISTGNIMYGNATSIVLNQNGHPIIAYYNNTFENLYLAEYNGSAWDIDFITSDSRFPILKMDAQGVLHLAYYRELTATSGQIFHAERVDSVWTFEEVDTMNNVTLGFSGARKNVDMVVQNGFVHLAYGDQKTIRYARRGSGVWSIELVVNLLGSSTILGQQVGLDLDSADNPHMTYYEVDNSSAEGGHIKHIYKTSSQGLLVNCPQDVTVYCDDSTNSNNTGEPVVLINPGTTVNITESDTQTHTYCLTGIDTITRTWTISNDFGQSVTCVQYIYRSRVNIPEIDFTQDMQFTNICYDDLVNFDLGTPSGLCGSADYTLEESMLTDTCGPDIHIQRVWTFEDTCIGVFHRDTQFVELHNYMKMDTANVLVIPDGGHGSGSISYDVMCGIPPYAFHWNINATSQNLGGLDPGVYTVTITDAVGCTIVIPFEVGTTYGPYIGGVVTDVNGNDIGVSVSAQDLNGEPLDDCTTSNIPGAFTFCTSGAMDIELCFDRDEQAINGVTAIDLVKATRIILGLVKPCPYNLLAGDVNFSGELTAADLFLIQRIILGKDEMWDIGESWFFTEGGSRFLCTEIPAEDQPDLDRTYVAVKLGDLSCQDTSLLTGQDIIETRTEKATVLVVEDIVMRKGETYRIPVMIDESQMMLAMQWGLLLGQEATVSSCNEALDNGYTAHHINNNAFSMIWHSAEVRYFSSGDPIVYIDILAQSDRWLSDVLSLDPSFDNLSYDHPDSEESIRLEFQRSRESHDAVIFPNPFFKSCRLDLRGLIVHKIEVFTAGGQRLLSIGQVDGYMELDASQFPGAGIYYVKMATDKGEKIEKLVRL